MLNWIYNVADLFSGRVHNSLVSLRKRVNTQENKMTENERRITEAAQTIGSVGVVLGGAIQGLRDRIEDLEGVKTEDISDELDSLDSAVAQLKAIGDSLAPATPGEGEGTGSTPNTPTPLAGESGPTDAGVPTEVVPPGTTSGDVPTTPVAGDAQAEANPNLGPSDDGSGIDVDEDPEMDDPDVDDEDADVDPADEDTDTRDSQFD